MKVIEKNDEMSEVKSVYCHYILSNDHRHITNNLKGNTYQLYILTIYRNVQKCIFIYIIHGKYIKYKMYYKLKIKLYIIKKHFCFTHFQVIKINLMKLILK